MAAWKLAPALAAGNTCVLKPAETTPLTALLLAEVCQQAGLPPGVVNVLTGAGAPALRWSATRGVDKIAFTGSTEVGKEISRAIAGTGKRLTLELGGKAANVVFDDAPVDQAVEGIVNGIFFNQGHVCCAGSRCSSRSPSPTPWSSGLRSGSRRCALVIRSTRTPTSARSTPASNSTRSVSCRRSGCRGSAALVAALPAAGEGLLVPADGLHRRQPVLPDRPRGDLRAGALRADVPHAGGGGGKGEQHAVRALGRSLD